MADCTCTETKRIIVCELNRGDGPCLTTQEPATPGQPPALNSDALTNTIAAALGANVITSIEGN
ncbi:hypothetical protein [Arthrobacter sp. LAR12-1-1.1]|uniref:hypothetical protein n=1 Tax=Arthrobacter sp. LAR12-1-1.1 TaxID=3135215 RepID=UPI0034216ABD